MEAFNFLSGLLLIIVVLTLLLVLYAEMKYGIDGTRRKLHVGITLHYLIVFLLILSTVMVIGDVMHSFRVTSQVYKQVLDDFQQQGQVNCSSSAYYPLFTSVVAFNYIFVEIGLLLLLCFWFIFDFHNFDYIARSYSSVCQV